MLLDSAAIIHGESVHIQGSLASGQLADVPAPVANLGHGHVRFFAILQVTIRYAKPYIEVG
jgi:hypothetical protein